MRMYVKAYVYLCVSYLVSGYQDCVVRTLAKTGIHWELYWWEGAGVYALERDGEADSRQGFSLYVEREGELERGGK